LFIRLHLGILAAIEIEHEEPKCRRKIGVLALIIHLADQFRQGRNTPDGNLLQPGPEDDPPAAKASNTIAQFALDFPRSQRV